MAPRHLFPLTRGRSLPPNEPVYGNGQEGQSLHGINLGALELRGETNMMRVSINTLIRLRHNPFFPYMEKRIVDTLQQPAVLN